MTDKVYQPVLSREKAQDLLDRVYDYQIDEIPRADLGEDGPRQIPLTPARQAALAVFSALSGRRGLDLHEVVGDVDIIGEIVDEATDIIDTAFDMGEGPINVDVARELNTIHQQGRDWELAYDADKKKFVTVVEPAAGGLEHYKSDSLFEAIRLARIKSEEAK